MLASRALVMASIGQSILRLITLKRLVIASGIQTHAAAALLIHESPRHGDLAVVAGRLRDGFSHDMDSGEIFALRVGGAVPLPELQVPLAGRLPPGGAKQSAGRQWQNGVPPSSLSPLSLLPPLKVIIVLHVNP